MLSKVYKDELKKALKKGKMPKKLKGSQPSKEGGDSKRSSKKSKSTGKDAEKPVAAKRVSRA